MVSHITENLKSENLLETKEFRTEAEVLAASVSIKTLTLDSPHCLIFTGTALGQVVKLQDATTISQGYRQSIHNNTTADIDILDNVGITLIVLRPKERIMAVLQTGGTQAGLWSLEFLSVSASTVVYGVPTSIMEDFSYDEQNFDIGHTPAGLVRYSTGTGAAIDILTGAELIDNRSHGVVRFAVADGTLGSRSVVYSENGWVRLGGSAVTLEYRVRIPTLSTATQRFTQYWGWMTGTTAAGQPTDGVYFIYSDNINGGKFALRTVASSVVSTFDVGIIPTINTWYKLKFSVIDGGSQVSVYLNDALIGRTALTIPIGIAIHPVMKMEKNVGSSTRYTYMDWMWWRIDRE